jgi:predicted dehydrogenase
MGSGDTETQLGLGSELVAVCDVYQGRLDRAKERWGSHLFTTRDHREVLARKDIDFVIIATPDHWHVPIALEAMEAGKDMYLQKPMVHDIAEGPKLLEAARRTGRIIEVGSERVSSVTYIKARELYQSGAIGELTMVEAYWRRNSAVGAWQYSIPPDASPETVDWDRFLGSAPKVPFQPIRLFRWRNYRDYGTGVAGDLFVHMFTGLHFVIGSNGPTRVVGMGGLRYWKDGRDVPDVMMAMCEYPKSANHPEFNLSLSLNFKAGSGEESGLRLIGTEGVMQVIPNLTVLSKSTGETEPGYTISTFTKATQAAFLKQYREKHPPRKASASSLRPVSEERFAAPRGYNEDNDHHASLLSAIRTRRPVVENEIFGLRSAAPALLCNLSHWGRRPMDWDPENMKMKNV